MANQTETAYMAVLSEVKQLVDAEGVETIMVDFEHRLRNAAKINFPTSVVAGCNAHYDRKITKLGLSALVQSEEEAVTALKKILALAYLPADVIPEAYTEIKSSSSLGLEERLRPFGTYAEWLRVMKPAGFSVHGLANRTSNVSESFNATLAHKLKRHPSL